VAVAEPLPPPQAAGSTVAPLTAAPPAALTSIGSDDTGSGASAWHRPLGLVLGGTGVVALGIGTYFGLRAISKKSDSEAHGLCNKTQCMNDKGLTLTHEAQHAATLANVFVVGSVALLAAGAVVYFTAPSERAPRLAVRGTGNGATLEFGGVL
jgi:hypothetical protein